MQNEIWKDIKGYEGLYQVSNLGRIKSLERKVEYTNNRPNSGNYETSNTYKERFIKFQKTDDGYLKCHLSKNGKSSYFRVHRIVAETFIPNPDNKPEVNHKDENKSNNSVSNLEWMTKLENINYGTRNQRCTDHLKKKVLCITTGEIFDSIKEAAKKYSCDSSTVGKVCNGKRKSTNGLQFKFI